jgi:aerobic-type carbon monoxide dehydrogenase small subunit (CoxS/CutS family)
MPQIKINGTQRNVEVDPQMPLLWAVRDVLGLTGTKFGCGIGACGAEHSALERRGRTRVHHANRVRGGT